MYSLYLTCPIESVELISADLWDLGTIGVREVDGAATTLLVAGFETNHRRQELLAHFAGYSPRWEHEDDTDWVQVTKDSWPAKVIGKLLFVVPPWNEDPTPPGHIRIIQNPGLACGTGDHPCTRLAMEALEECVTPKRFVADVGSGSAILTITASLLGAQVSVGVDVDVSASAAALENFGLNDLMPTVASGSAECLRSGVFDIVVANISSTVVLSVFDELMRIAKPGATVILTGFSAAEANSFVHMLQKARISELGDWACVVGRRSS